MSRTVIHTELAPAAIGTYSQAIRVNNTVYLSGQIGLDPYSMDLVDGIEAQIRRVFDNLKAVCEASGGSLADIEEGLKQGRGGVMPAFGELLSAERIHVLTAYVYGLSRQQ